jgi:TPR repeat protein
MTTFSLLRNILAGSALVLALTPGLLHASLADDWQTCTSTVLNHPSAQNRTDAFSEYCLGLASMQGFYGTKDQVAAARYYRLAADQNLPAAEFTLGYYYERGYGVPRDHATAIMWWSKAAAAGSADANFMLGKAYENGSGVAKDPAQANRYYQIAAQQGSEDAKRKLANSGFESQPGIDLVK